MRIPPILALLFSISLCGQNEMNLSFWSDAMVNANNPENRMAAHKIFHQAFKEKMLSSDAFDFELETIPELHVVADTSNTFKIITYQIQESEDKFQYHGYLIKKDGSFYELKDAFNSLEDIDFLTLNDEEWLGGIYYNLVQMGDFYFVFSYRQNDKFTKFKSFDCLTFSEDGDPILGSEIFVFPQENIRNLVKSRVTFNYSSDALLSLNYNREMGMVVHDHLMQVIGKLPGQGPTFVPDGTYEGYLFEDGRWTYNEKLFHHTYDEAPRPAQILGKDKRDVFGNQKKKN
jgi:hypothetical protein